LYFTIINSSLIRDQKTTSRLTAKLLFVIQFLERSYFQAAFS